MAFSDQVRASGVRRALQRAARNADFFHDLPPVRADEGASKCQRVWVLYDAGAAASNQCLLARPVVPALRSPPSARRAT